MMNKHGTLRKPWRWVNSVATIVGLVWNAIITGTDKVLTMGYVQQQEQPHFNTWRAVRLLIGTG